MSILKKISKFFEPTWEEVQRNKAHSESKYGVDESKFNKMIHLMRDHKLTECKHCGSKNVAFGTGCDPMTGFLYRITCRDCKYTTWEDGDIDAP